METFPWEPPDGASGASSSEFGAQVGGHGWEIPGREGDAHGAAASPGAGLEGEVAGCQEVHLDLGLGDITRYSSYSKLWRTLYFVNDAPFRIRNRGCKAAGEWSTGPLG